MADQLTVLASYRPLLIALTQSFVVDIFFAIFIVALYYLSRHEYYLLNVYMHFSIETRE